MSTTELQEGSELRGATCAFRPDVSQKAAVDGGLDATLIALFHHRVDRDDSLSPNQQPISPA